MSQLRIPPLHITRMPSSAVTITLLFAANLGCNILANTSFKLSALGANWKILLGWQVVGNLAGFLSVLALTGLLRQLPLSVAYPISMGLAIIGVQLVGAALVFHENISVSQWLGTLLIIGGIFLIQR